MTGGGEFAGAGLTSFYPGIICDPQTTRKNIPASRESLMAVNDGYVKEGVLDQSRPWDTLECMEDEK